MHGIHEWYEREFEKFGWMLLARAKGYDFKLRAYCEAIQHLLKTIEHVAAEYKDPDRRHDLNVLRMNTEVLLAAAQKL